MGNPSRENRSGIPMCGIHGNLTPAIWRCQRESWPYLTTPTPVQYGVRITPRSLWGDSDTRLACARRRDDQTKGPTARSVRKGFCEAALPGSVEGYWKAGKKGIANGSTCQ
jgi:hypothetical protein